MEELDGHRLREYFQTPGYQHVFDLHENFPKLMDSEDKGYIERVNDGRKRLGLSLF